MDISLKFKVIVWLWFQLDNKATTVRHVIHNISETLPIL